MADLNDLANSMDQLALKVPDFANQVAKDVVTTILNDLTQVTPVDTGEAVSNWQVSLDQPVLTIIPAYVPSPKGHTKQGVFIHKVDPVITAQANVQPTLDASKIALAAKAPGQPAFITNNVEHIVALDQGSSIQAPAGFVAGAVILGEQVVGRARII